MKLLIKLTVLLVLATFALAYFSGSGTNNSSDALKMFGEKTGVKIGDMVDQYRSHQK